MICGSCSLECFSGQVELFRAGFLASAWRHQTGSLFWLSSSVPPPLCPRGGARRYRLCVQTGCLIDAHT
jgi:hypothetical protein